MSRCDHHGNALHSKKPKKRCIGSPDFPACAEMIIDYGQRDRCLECRASVTRANARKYAKNRNRRQAMNDNTGPEAQAEAPQSAQAR